MSEQPPINPEEPKKEEGNKEQQSPDEEKIKIDLPKVPVEVIKMTKAGGITLPKQIRDTLPENAIFAFWQEENKLIFQEIKEYHIPELTLANPKPEPKKPREKKTDELDAEGKPKVERAKRQKKPAGPEPELTRYFPFPFEGQEKVASVLESTFYKLGEENPNLNEAIERLRYILVNYAKGNLTNDSRLYNSLVTFVLDVIEKIQNPVLGELIPFVKEKIVPGIRSKFLKEQSLITAFIAAIKIQQNEIAKEFLTDIIQGIRDYPDSDAYAIMQGFNNLISTIKKNQLELPTVLKNQIRDELKNFINGYEIQSEDPNAAPIKHSPVSTENAIILIDHLEVLSLIEDAYNTAESLLQRLPPEDRSIDKVREKVNKLSKKAI